MRKTLKPPPTYNVSKDLGWTVDFEVNLSTIYIQLTKKKKKEKIWLMFNFENGIIEDKNQQSFYYLRFSTWGSEYCRQPLSIQFSLAMAGNNTFCNFSEIIPAFMPRPCVTSAGIRLLS